MKIGDKVKHIKNSRKVGTVVLVTDSKVAVDWKMGTGWSWVVAYDKNELEEVA